MCFMLYFVFSDLVCCLLLNVSLGGVITLVGEERAVLSTHYVFYVVLFIQRPSLLFTIKCKLGRCDYISWGKESCFEYSLCVLCCILYSAT